MAAEPKTRYTYADLEQFPDDNLRREIIDGELFVTPAPILPHQRVVARLVGRLLNHAEAHGGEVFPSPTDVFFSDHDVVEPDVLFMRAEHAERLERKFVRSAPDLVVEVSSPSTRRFELLRKLSLYERYGVPEYWYIDLEAERVEVYTLHDGRYGQPRMLVRGDTLETPEVPGFAIAVDYVLGEPETGLTSPQGAGP